MTTPSATTHALILQPHYQFLSLCFGCMGHHLLTRYLIGPIAVISALIVCTIAYLRWIKRQQTSSALEKKSSLNQTDWKVLQPKPIFFDLHFRNLGLKLASGKNVLESVNGSILHGRTTAIMGPSGCGKTTFMSTLSGRATYGTTTGSIQINDAEDSLLKYPKLVGFVPQEDTMHRDCTVVEVLGTSFQKNLRFSALTRLSNELSSAEKEHIVNEVLCLLGLEEIQDSLIGDEDVRGISGGQRKRVNIGIELVADPSILFLDEPTSGLDSSSSKEICTALQRIARGSGMTIVAVIHSPRYEIFEMFDDVLMLGKGGRTVYLGPTNEALAYFESLGFRCGERVNPADFMMDVIAGEVPRVGDPDFTPAQLPQLWRAHSVPDLPFSNPLQAVNESASNRSSISIVLDENAPLLPLPVNQESKLSLAACPAMLPIGTWWHFLLSFVMCFFFYFLLPVCLYCRPRTLRWLQGGLLATTFVCFGAFAWTPSLLVSSLSGDVKDHDPIGYDVGLTITFGMYLLLTGALLLLTIYYIARGKDLRYFAHFVCGACLSVFFFPFVWFKQHDTNAKMRYFGTMGILAGILTLTATLVLTMVFATIYAAVGVAFLGSAMLYVTLHRYKRIPTFDRTTSSIFHHIMLVFERAIKQQLRQPVGLLFDITLPIFSAVFLGLIFYDRYYTAPLISHFHNWTCSNTSVPFPINDSTNVLPTSVCAFLELPPNDPIARNEFVLVMFRLLLMFPLLAQATLTTMSVALAATASSMRIFGAEQTVFKREARAKLSAEAYYIGKSLAHLLTCVVSSLCFTLFYYALLLPVGVPLWKYLLFYFLIYFTCAGMAYAISLVTPVHLSQLAGVLCILVFMMFSGANPTLQQLKHNALIPYVLYLPTFASLFRWSNELYYLMEVAPYHPSEATLLLYSYDPHRDVQKCIMMLILIAGISRLLGYVAVVRKDE